MDMKESGEFHTHTYHRDDKIYAFDCKNMVLCEIDDVTEALLAKMAEGEDCRELYRTWGEGLVEDAAANIAELMEQDLFFSPEKTRHEESRIFEEGYISFPPMHRCNLRCRYCFAASGNNYKETQKKFTRETIEKALHFIYFDYMKECKRYRIDFVSGGEPLLNFEAVKAAREIGDKLYRETGKPLYMWLCTNGTLMDDSVLTYMNTNEIDLGISIDGPKEIHDRMRRDENDFGTYDIVTENIRSIMKNPDYGRKLKEIWALSVITSKTDSLINAIRHNKALGLKSMQMKIVRSAKESDLSINESNMEHFKKLYSDLVDFFKNELKEGRFEYLCMILNDNDFIGKIIVRLILRNPVTYRCFAAKEKISICANGDIYPCDSFVGNTGFLMGNIYEGVNQDIREKFYSLSVFDRPRCKVCWARFVCGGDCYHNSLLSNGSIEEPDDIICSLTKYVIELSLDLMEQLNKNEKAAKILLKFLKARITHQ